MRKYLRSIARANMKRAGIQRINKPRVNMKGIRVKSYFAENWRKYI